MNRNKTLEIKISLLSEGIDFDINLFKNFTKIYYDNQFVYGKTSSHVTPKHRFPQVLLLENNVVVAILRKEKSPWKLKLNNQELQLFNNNDFIQIVDLPERPKYFDSKLSDGTISEFIIAVAGEDTPGFFLYPKCFYFSSGKPCKFCGMENTRKTVGKYMVSDFSKENLIEATNLFVNTSWRDICLISISTGTCRTDIDYINHIIEPLRFIQDAVNGNIAIHLLAHPPNDLKLIDELKKAGITTIAFNLEVFDQEYFQKICPGKDKLYGYDKWFASLEYAKKVFGDYNVFCGLIWGLEPIESTIKGHEYFAKNKIGLASNIFHADTNSTYRNHPHLSKEDILKIAKSTQNLYLKYPLMKTIFSVSMRSTIDWEIYNGYLN